MMKFRELKDSIICNVLGPNAGGKFQVVEYQRQGKAAEEVLDYNRMVQVFYGSGEFPKGSGKRRGSVSHDIMFRIELTVSASASTDLTILDNPASTDEERAAAIRASLEGGARADASFDELVDLVYQILMDARHIDLGMPAGTVANSWINRVEKNRPLDRGEYVLLTGSMNLGCRVSEDLTGIPLGDPGSKVMDTVIDVEGDDTEKTGIEVTTP